MKKFILSILAFLYIFGTTGTTLREHYCMGQLASWSIGNSGSDTCGRCGMAKSADKDNSCCSDEETFVKNTTDQKPGTNAGQLFQSPVCTQPCYPLHSTPVSLTPLTACFLKEAPPRCTALPRYILNATFRI